MAGDRDDLIVKVGMDGADFDRGAKNLNDKMKLIQSQMKASSNSLKDYGSSLDGLKSKQDALSKMHELQGQKVQKLRTRYDELVKTQGENSQAALRAGASLNNAIAYYNRLGNELESVESDIQTLSEALDRQNSVWGRASAALESYSDRAGQAGNTMKDIGQNLSAGVTAPLLALGGMALKTADDFNKAQNNIQSDLGISAEKAAELNEVARELWKEGFGENIQDVSSKIAGVTKSLGDLSKVDLSYVTKGLEVFESKGWGDQAETLRAINVLMKSFGMTSKEAMDYLTRGFQENLDYSGEFLDSVSEYSTYFAEMGLDANDMFAKFKAGAESGAFQLDKIGDSMKEFSLRAKDGSKASTEAFQALGLNAKEMTTAFNKGGDTAKKAFETVIRSLQGVEDETKRNEISTSLWGTQFEDLGEAAFDAMLSASQGLTDVAGATEKAGQALKDNLGARVQSELRQLGDVLVPFGEVLMDVVEPALDAASEKVEDFTEWMSGLSDESKKLIVTMAGIAAAAGPSLIAFGSLTQGAGALMGVVAKLLPALGAGTGLAATIGAIAGPATLVAGTIGVLAAVFASIKNDMKEAKEVNLEYAESMITQQQEIEGLSSQYQALSDKNKLSNDELLRFKDINDQLDLATSADEIARLKDEQAGLQEKSGLTNEEMTTLLDLNDQLIEKVPGVTTAFSDHGNAVIANADALTVANERLRENIALELENQRIKAEAKLTENITAYVQALEELNVKEKERNTLIKDRDAVEKNLAALKIQAQEQINAGKDEEADKTVKEIVNQQLLLGELNSKIEAVADEVSEKQKSVQQTETEIQRTQDLYNKMINLQLAQVGINAEGETGIKQLDDAIAKTQQRIDELNAAKTAQGGLNAEQQKELDNLLAALGMYQDAKGEIKQIQTEQSSVNRKIQEGTGEAEKLTKELDKDVKKEVDVDDKGEADKLQQKLEKEAIKKVRINAILEGAKNALKVVLPGFAAGTRNAPGGLSLVGERGPELVHLPRGASVIPNDDTEKLLRKWNVPVDNSLQRIAQAAGVDIQINKSFIDSSYPADVASPMIKSTEETKENANIAVLIMDLFKKVNVEVVL